MAGLTTFQKKKFEKVFSMLYDSNGDGVIEKEDFDILLGKIQSILGWEKNSPKYKNAESTLQLVWDGLVKVADFDSDAKITIVEWETMWGGCIEEVKKGQFPDWQKKYMDFMFDVNDKSGDDCIDQSEYTTFMKHFIKESECKAAFDKISAGGQGQSNGITRDDFAKLWKEYLTSDDQSLPGNSLFGPI
ncbi:calexcitin-2-like [Mercenaria mercenaria]|uniref:calexcitin-2-like n=1 Tax=Mercenaria mercenaria TaxID=6596 RepID=UPI001E1D3072|nr:calexcitin-2-like [Mercenaria mercenaria]